MVAKILIADDDILFRKILCRKLSRSLDVIVDEVSTVPELIERATQHQYDLVLTDQDIGENYEIQQIRELGYEGPIILHSSFVGPELEKEAIDAGANYVLSKMDASGLMDKIKEYIA